MSKNLLGWGALVDGVLILMTQYFGWPDSLNYLWGALAVIWGIIAFKKNN
ncbi:MAG: hypothetical protein AAB884_01575 [Patescibacteria group bacterium]